MVGFQRQKRRKKEKEKKKFYRFGNPVGLCSRNLCHFVIPKDHRNCPPLLVSASNVRLLSKTAVSNLMIPFS